MKSTKLLTQILLTFVITLVTAGVVTLVWNLVIERSGAIIDWKTSLIMAIIIGIAVPLSKKDK